MCPGLAKRFGLAEMGLPAFIPTLTLLVLYMLDGTILEL